MFNHPNKEPAFPLTKDDPLWKIIIDEDISKFDSYIKEKNIKVENIRFNLRRGREQIEKLILAHTPEKKIAIFVQEIKLNSKAKDKNDRTLLHVVAALNLTKMFDHLVENYKLDPKTKTSYNNTILNFIAILGHTKLLDHVVEKHKFNVNDDYGDMLLYLIAVRGSTKMFDHFVKNYEFDPKAKDKKDRTPLNLSIQYNQHEYFKHILNSYYTPIEALDELIKINKSPSKNFSSMIGGAYILYYLLFLMLIRTP